MTSFLTHLHTRYSEGEINEKHIDFSLVNTSTDKQKMYDVLISELQSDDSQSLFTILNSSSWINSHKINVLILHNVEHLTEKALKALLGGIRGIEEKGNHEFISYKFQILIEGSQLLQELTGGPISILPLPNIFPREFEKGEMRNFAFKRELIMSDGAINLIWEKTQGDIAICHFLFGQLYQLGRKIILSDAKNVLDDYINSINVNHELRDVMLSGIYELCSIFSKRDRLTLRDLAAFFDLNEELSWFDLKDDVAEILFKHGLIRKVSDDKFMIRAPIIAEISKSCIKRFDKLERMIASELPLNEFSNELRSKIEMFSNETFRAAIFDSLLVFHVGHGIYSKGVISFEGMAYNHGSYEGEWDVKDLLFRFKEGQEVVCMQQKTKDSPSTASSKLFIEPLYYE